MFCSQNYAYKVDGWVLVNVHFELMDEKYFGASLEQHRVTFKWLNVARYFGFLVYSKHNVTLINLLIHTKSTNILLNIKQWRGEGVLLTPGRYDQNLFCCVDGWV